MESILNILACMTVFNQLRLLITCGDMRGLSNLLKRVINSLFLLTTEFLNFYIQNQIK